MKPALCRLLIAVLATTAVAEVNLGPLSVQPGVVTGVDTNASIGAWHPGNFPH
ncbi:MAG: hypothetical protein IJU44_13130 [Kiritimatiellae bacterium]|nr:hypothetical protein [Kiritimatiellia bacterium]